MSTIENLLQYGASNRRLRAYAYLTASLKTKPRYGEGVSDAFDCLMPFVVAGTSAQAENQISFPDLIAYLRTLGLNVPVYVLEQLVPRLVALGALQWDPAYRVHICRMPNATIDAGSTSGELGPVFDEIEVRLVEFAESHGISQPLASTSWADALIAFLKSENASEVVRVAKIKDAIIGEADKVDSYVVARFIDNASTTNPDLFDNIIQIFTGILIEDFITNIQGLGDPSSYKELALYYDTTVLLRLLGTSGKFLQLATIDMHRILQDLGCKTLYFDHIENEVITIISAVLAAHAAGKELFEETGDAMLKGEISAADLKDYLGTYSERLAVLGIFKSRATYRTTRSADREQIDEERFSRAIESEAIRQDRTYSRQNAEHDATSVALILRLRGGVQTKDVASARHLFISRNRLLQRIARKYLIDYEGYHWTSVPAILTIGQIATVGWLAGSKGLEPARVTRELLSNCYLAMRPDQNWARAFLDALDDIKKENPEIVEKYADSLIFLRAARAIAQDESLNQTAVFRRLNTVELFKRAAEIADEREREQQAAASDAIAAAERQRVDDLAIAEREARDAIAAAAHRTRVETIEEQRARIRDQSNSLAWYTVRALQSVTVVLFGTAFFIRETQALGTHAYIKWTAVSLLGLLCILHAADLFGIKFIEKGFDRLREFVAKRISNVLARLAGI
jgi:hypothetical protein